MAESETTVNISETTSLLGAEVHTSLPCEDVEAPSSSLNGGENKKTASILGLLSVLLVGVFVANADTSLVLATYGEISSEFDNLNNASWLMTSYLLAMAGTQPLYGKMSNIYGRKNVLLTSYVFFAIGCFICGTATSMSHVIIGRIVGGVGGAGMHSVVSFLITDLVPIRDVATYRSYVNVVQTVGRSCGGPIGGYLAQTIGWRWSFLIQTPLTMLALLLVWWRLQIPKRVSDPMQNEATVKDKLARIDFLGSILLCSTIVTLLLALSMGGNQYPWASPVIIGLFGLHQLLAIAFFYVELRVAKEPVFPLYLLKVGVVTLTFIVLIMQNIAQTLMMFSIPLYFQVTASVLPSVAGAYLIPAVVGNTLGGLATGHYIQHTGSYKMPTIFASLIAAVAHTLTTVRWTGNTSTAESLYSFPGGLGTGIAHSSTFVALTASVSEEDAAIAGGGLYLSGNVGSVLGFTLASLVMKAVVEKSALAKLGDGMRDLVKKSLDDVSVLQKFEGRVREAIVEAYVDGFRGCFGLAILCCALSLICAVCLKSKKLE